MKKIFSKIIIGSGPSAIGSILALKEQNYDTLVITGNQKKNKINLKNIHKKIIYESEIPKIGNFFFNKADVLFSICDVGGFGNYWGQGSEYVKYDKLYIKNYFKNKSDYKNVIEFIYSSFKISRDENKIQLNTGKLYSSPILKNAINKTNTELKSFKTTFNYLTKKKKIKVAMDKVVHLGKSKNIFILKTSMGKKYYCKKVFLASGVLGNAKIILKSDNSIDKLNFFDDCPWLIYAINLNQNLKYKISDKTSLISSNLNSYFFSLYNMSKIKLSFFIFYFLNIKINFLNRFRCSRLNFLSFIQLWTQKTIVKFTIQKNYKFETVPCNKDNDFKKFKKRLVKDKIFPLITSKTKPGNGFHYHNLLVYRNNKRVKFSNYLKQKFKKNIFCVDSSVISKINPGPFTITQMAISYNVMKKNGV